ncbi:MAG TPA: nodulation protein NodZ [Terrimicrobiaceae bacterium]|nr:nodulation protein NodZ [Terrimicrobiaceae bacterium]
MKSYYGLGGDLCTLLGAWRLARQLDRELVVDWSGGRYGSVEDGNLFARFFSSPRLLCPADVPGLTSMSVFPQEWHGRAALPPVTYLEGVDLTHSRPDDVPADCSAQCIVITRDSRDLIPKVVEFGRLADELVLREELQAAVAPLIGTLAAKKHSIGLHFRHGNGERKVMAPDPRWFRNRINGKLKQLGLAPDDLALYVATDCEATLRYFRQYYPGTVSLPKAYRPNGSGALHVARDDLSADQKIQMAREALIDMFTLARCATFIGSRGYFSLVPRLLRQGRDCIIYPGVRVVTPDEILVKYAPARSDPVYGPIIKRMKLPIDGLLVQSIDGQRTLRYYEDAVYSIPAGTGSLGDDEMLAIRRAVVARRTY